MILDPGGKAIWMLAINAFMTDITKPDERAFRFGMIHLASSLGRPLASPLGAYLLRTGGFLCVFSTTLVGIFIGAISLLLRIRKYKWNPPKSNKVIIISENPCVYCSMVGFGIS